MIVVACIAALAMVACTTADEPSASPTTAIGTTASPSPAPAQEIPTESATSATSDDATEEGDSGSQKLHPPGTRTGVPAIDRVLDAIDGDRPISDLIVMTGIACVVPGPGVGQLPCPEGREPGEIVPAFAIGSCAPNYEVSAATAIARVMAVVDGTLLYGAYHSQQALGDIEIPYELVMAANTEEFGAAVSIWIDAEGNIRGAFSCGFPTYLEPILAPVGPQGDASVPGTSPASSDSKMSLSDDSGCMIDLPHETRWPDFAAGGPTDGPVTMVMSSPVTRGSNGIRKVLMLLDRAHASTGTSIDLREADSSPAKGMKFRYGAGNDFSSPRTVALPPREGPEGTPYDLPGQLWFPEPGCYAFEVLVDGVAWGPFTILVEDARAE